MIGNTDGVSVIEMIMGFLACSEVTDILHCNLCSTQLDRLHRFWILDRLDRFYKASSRLKKKKQYIPVQILQNNFLKKLLKAILDFEVFFSCKKMAIFWIEKHFTKNVLSASVFNFYCVYQISRPGVFLIVIFILGQAKELS